MFMYIQVCMLMTDLYELKMNSHVVLGCPAFTDSDLQNKERREREPRCSQALPQKHASSKGYPHDSSLRSLVTWSVQAQL